MYAFFNIHDYEHVNDSYYITVTYNKPKVIIETDVVFLALLYVNEHGNRVNVEGLPKKL